MQPLGTEGSHWGGRSHQQYITHRVQNVSSAKMSPLKQEALENWGQLSPLCPVVCEICVYRLSGRGWQGQDGVLPEHRALTRPSGDW